MAFFITRLSAGMPCRILNNGCRSEFIRDGFHSVRLFIANEFAPTVKALYILSAG